MMGYEAAAVAAAVCLAVLFVCLFIVPTVWVKVERVRFKLGLGKKILQISDLHVERLRVSPARLQRIIMKERPDYIFLTGDYTEKPGKIARVGEYLKAIAETGIAAYAVLGNHDHRLKGHLVRLLHLFRVNGITVLQNESVDMGEFRLVGIDDLTSRKAKVGKAFAGERPGSGNVTLVMAHDPNTTLQIRRPYSYLFSGHFHGGQFRLPFLYLMLNKGPLVKRGIISGLHRDENGAFYISKGIGQAGVNMRLFIRSEVTVHEL